MKKKLILIACTYTTSFLVQYSSLYKFKDHQSSMDLKTWLSEQALYFAFISTLLLSLIFFLTKNTPKLINRLINTICIIGLWYFFIYQLFVEFESAWSTYLFNEELITITYLSFLPITIFTIILMFCKKRLLK